MGLFCGVRRLSRCNSDELSALIGKAGLNKHGPEPDKFSCSSGGGQEVGCECARVAPCMETKVAILPGTGIDADAEDEKAKDSDDFNAGKPKFDFSVE